MALTLSARVDADFSSLVAESKEAQRAIEQLSVEADRLNADARDMAAGLSEADRSARDAAVGITQVEREAKETAAAVDNLSRAFSQMKPGGTLTMTAAEFKAVSEEAARSGRSFEETLGGNRAALDAMRAAHDPLFAAQRQYLDQLASIRAAEAAGALPREQARVALAATKAEFAATVPIIRSQTAAIMDSSKAVALQRWQLINLGQQVQDVGVQLAMGMNPLMIAAQQGPQIVSAAGGTQNFMALARQYITPTKIAVGGLTAALATGAMAWSSYLGSVKPVETALAGVGRRIGATRGEMEAMAYASADAGEISTREARELQVTYLRTGRIGEEVMAGLITRTKDYAATMGVDLITAGEDLAKAFAEPAKGAEELNKSLQFLTDAEVEDIRRMEQRGETMRAQIAILEALDRATIKYRDSVTVLGSIWGRFSRGASDLWNSLGNSIDAGFRDTPATEERLGELLSIRERLANHTGPIYNRAGYESDLADLDAEIKRMQIEVDRARQKGAEGDISAATTRAGVVARRYSPDTTRLDQLRSDQAQVSSDLLNPAIRDNIDNLTGLERAYDASSRAIETWLDPASRATEQHRLDIAAISAKTPAQLAEIAAERERLALAGEAISTGEAEARIANAREQAYREAAFAIEDQNAQIGLNARLTLDVADAWLTSAAAGERAAAMQQAMNDNFATGADVATRFRLVLSDHAAQVALTGAQSAAQYEAEALALGRLNDAVASRSMNVAQANREAQIEAQLRPLITAAANAEGTTKEALTRIIDELTAAMRNYNAEAGRSVGLSMQEAQRDEIAMLELQRQHVWSSTQVRDEATAVRLKELEALRAGVEAGSAEMASILEQERAIVRLTAALSNENATREIVMSTTENALNKVADQLASGELSWSSWGDVAVSVLQDVTRQLTRMAITAPIMNGLFGTNMPTLADAGGLIGSIFHAGGVIGTSGKPSRFVPHNLVASAPRFHSGGLINDNERVIIAEVGEEMLTANDPRHIRNIRRPAGTGSGWGGGDAPRVELHIHEAPGTKVERRETQMPDGGIRIDAMVRLVQSAVADDVANGRSPINSSIEGRYGLRAARK